MRLFLFLDTFFFKLYYRYMIQSLKKVSTYKFNLTKLICYAELTVTKLNQLISSLLPDKMLPLNIRKDS